MNSEEEKLHNELIFNIGKLSDEKDFKDVKLLCGKKLTKQEIEAVNDICELMEELEKRGLIKCGDYEQISEVFQTARLPKVVKIIEEYTDKIKKAAETRAKTFKVHGNGQSTIEAHGKGHTEPHANGQSTVQDDGNGHTGFSTTITESDGQSDDTKHTKVKDVVNLSQLLRKRYIEEFHEYHARREKEKEPSCNTQFPAKLEKLDGTKTKYKTEPLSTMDPTTNDVVEELRGTLEKNHEQKHFILEGDKKDAEALEHGLKYKWATSNEEEDQRPFYSFGDISERNRLLEVIAKCLEEALKLAEEALKLAKEEALKRTKVMKCIRKIIDAEFSPTLNAKNQKLQNFKKNKKEFNAWERLLLNNPIIIYNEYTASEKEKTEFERFIGLPEVKDNCTILHIRKQNVSDLERLSFALKKKYLHDDTGQNSHQKGHCYGIMQLFAVVLQVDEAKQKCRYPVRSVEELVRTIDKFCKHCRYRIKQKKGSNCADEICYSWARSNNLDFKAVIRVDCSKLQRDDTIIDVIHRLLPADTDIWDNFLWDDLEEHQKEVMFVLDDGEQSTWWENEEMLQLVNKELLPKSTVILVENNSSYQPVSKEEIGSNDPKEAEPSRNRNKGSGSNKSESCVCGRSSYKRGMSDDCSGLPNKRSREST